MGHTHAGMAALTWGLNVNYILLTPDLNVVQVLTIVIVVMVGLAFASFQGVLLFWQFRAAAKAEKMT